MTWFGIEGHADPVAVAKLRSSLGFCAAHARRVLAEELAEVTLGVPYRSVVRAARRVLDAQQPRTRCPACVAVANAEQRTLVGLVAELGDPAVARAYAASDGLCLPHLQSALRSASDADAGRLVAAVLESARVDFGSDPDANLRATCRARIPQPREQAQTTFGRLLELFEHGACPTCLGTGRAERDT